MKPITRAILIIFLACFSATTSLAYGVENNESWLIVPGVKAGSITSHTTEVDLTKIFGKQNVKRDVFYYEEGMESEICTTIYPNDPEKKIQIFWKDSKQMKSPKRLVISGDRSQWKTAEGISLGTTLKEIEKLNGGPFTLNGFGWDSGGDIQSWDNGKLDKKYFQTIDIRFDDKDISAAQRREQRGRSISSRDEQLQKINPIINQISIFFR